ncbi:MAG: HD domain-containing protein [Spirochaetales bacterium]|nr:HD domain-containing protein [Spirochaetales bacterium]MBR4426341.1 HD domain-containing protein [Spirochaetales bacterium]
MPFKNELPDSVLLSRVKSRTGDDVRSPYYRDTTAIIHSSPFRRLKHKTQVFFAPSNDHICTRMEHVLHVASIATAICRAMGLNDELAWAIGVGHDLGHTPFGHIGEYILSDMMVKKGFPKFEHEINGLRVVDFLSHLNLTYAVRDGIVSHCGEHFIRTISPDFTEKDLGSITTKAGLRPSTWEGCVVRFSDQIAYLGRDFEDAVRLGIVKPKDAPDICFKVLGKTNGEIINTLVEDIITNSEKEGCIAFSEEVYEAVRLMKEFNYRSIYLSPMLKGYEDYFRRLIGLIYEYLTDLLDRCELDKDKYLQEGNMLSAGFYNYVVEKKAAYIEHDGNLDRIVFDYIAGMSDNFCLDCGNEILRPEHLNQSIERSLTGKWFDAVL